MRRINASVSCFILSKACIVKLIRDIAFASSGQSFQGRRANFTSTPRPKKSTTRKTLVRHPSVHRFLLLGECFSLAAARFFAGAVVRICPRLRVSRSRKWIASQPAPRVFGPRSTARRLCRCTTGILPWCNRYAVFEATRFSAAPSGPSTVDGSRARSLA